MNRDRFDRPDFNWAHYLALDSDDGRNRLLFDWWCDDADRQQLLKQLLCGDCGKPLSVPGRAPRQNDPAPRLDKPAPQGFRDLYLITDPAHVRWALADASHFSNIPYAALGGASFLLAQDPGPGYAGINWHAEQKEFIQHVLSPYKTPQLQELACIAVEQASLTSLARPEFDLAHWAEQAALRYFGQLYGYGFQDHGVLEDASRSTYRALQYLAIGQHFVSEPATLPAAQQALGRLVARTSTLMEDYTQLARSKRWFGPSWLRNMPEGTQPWSQLSLSRLGDPVLKAACGVPGPLSGRDRATVLATLLAGTLGNVVTAVCLLVQQLMTLDDDKRKTLCEIKSDQDFEDALKPWHHALAPVPVLPRRTLAAVSLGDVTIPADADCLLLLEAALGHGCPRHGAVEDGWSFGASNGAWHGCLGRHVSMPLITHLVRRAFRLPGLKPARDALTGQPLPPERLWGFACTRYPLLFDRERARMQQNLIAAMRVKAPVAENAGRLRLLIAGAVPRIDHVLTGFQHVHFAWFEFSDDETHLVLRTVYDGQLEAYLEHFAYHAGDLFDGLFEFLEDAPPRPVAEHPREFIDTVRRFNRAPLAGYLYSAYPQTEAQALRGSVPPRNGAAPYEDKP